MEPIVGVCPVCGKKTLKTFFEETNIPHFGRVIISTSVCSNCGFRHSDVYEVEEREPARFVLHVDRPEKLNYYVIRSSTGRLEIPDAGMELSPGPFSQGFVTTVEGVLERFLSVLPLFKNLGDVSSVERFLLDAKEGRVPFTVVLEDPRGLSRIVGEDVIVERGGGSSRPRGGKNRASPGR